MTTRTETRKQEARERARALHASFDARIAAQDADDPLTDDHHFNPKHPDFDPNCFCGVTGERPVAHDVLNDTSGDAATAMPQRRVNGDRLKTASSKSVAYLEQLLEQAKRRLNDPSLIELAIAALSANNQRDVSETIDELKRQLKKVTSEMRSNKYPGPCHTCGQTVEAEAGVLSKTHGRWIVLHGADPEDCPAKTDTPAPQQQPDTSDLSGRRTPERTLDLSSLPSGRYAVPGGDTRLKIRVDNLKLDKPRNPRWDNFIFVKDAAEYGQAKRYGTQRPGQLYAGDVQDELEAIMDDPQAALAAYGQLTGHCGVCGRKLEDETSVALGIGPVCRSKLSF